MTSAHPLRARPATHAAEAEVGPSPRGGLRRIHLLLTAQSVVLVLASINRLWSATDAEILPGEALRVVDVMNLLVLAPASALLFLLLLEHVLAGAAGQSHAVLRVAFAGALYLFAASYGMHEPADYLNQRFCGGDGDPALCAIVAYQDDELSHSLYFAGLIGISTVLLLAQSASTIGVLPTGRDLRAVLANASLVAAAIVANLGFEEIGLDLVVVAAVAVTATVLLLRRGPRALTVYFAAGYGAGLLLTIAVKVAAG